MTVENVFTIQGTVLSKVPCQLERHRRANNLGVDVKDIPLTYGSVRIGVNYIKLGDTVYCLQRYESKEVDEERFIIEISYRYDLEINDGITLVEEHSIINKINQGDLLNLTLNNTFTKSKHNVKLIRPRVGYCVKSYFTKAWAESILEVSKPTLIPTDNLEVKKVFSKLSQILNRELTFA